MTLICCTKYCILAAVWAYRLWINSLLKKKVINAHIFAGKYICLSQAKTRQRHMMQVAEALVVRMGSPNEVSKDRGASLQKKLPAASQI